MRAARGRWDAWLRLRLTLKDEVDCERGLYLEPLRPVMEVDVAVGASVFVGAQVVAVELRDAPRRPLHPVD